ncbi:hypothetical protein J6590_036405 [Homalodisca vitripennis]|nr:hypothetical protein J6590_036405 [Homalodisca vitripennis]
MKAPEGNAVLKSRAKCGPECRPGQQEPLVLETDILCPQCVSAYGPLLATPDTASHSSSYSSTNGNEHTANIRHLFYAILLEPVFITLPISGDKIQLSVDQSI